MTSTQIASITFVIALVVLPQVVALYLSEPSESKPEHGYDYR